MKKVVYNACFGGFGLSCEALALLVLFGFPFSEAHSLAESGYEEGEFTLTSDWGIRAHPRYSVVLKDGKVYSDHLFHAYDAAGTQLRSHPLLVKVVEMLGNRANGHCAELKVHTLPSTSLYRIQEYDGRESVEEFTQDHYVLGFEYQDMPLPPGFQLQAIPELLTHSA